MPEKTQKLMLSFSGMIFGVIDNKQIILRDLKIRSTLSYNSVVPNTSTRDFEVLINREMRSRPWDFLKLSNGRKKELRLMSY